MDSYYSAWSNPTFNKEKVPTYKPKPSAPALVPHKPVKVITQNAFQIPWFTSTYNKIANKISTPAEYDTRGENCRDQEIRAVRLIEEIKDYDIVALQEMWGSNMDTIYNAMKEQELKMPNELTSHIVSGRMAEYYNHRSVIVKQTGGLFFGAKTPIIWYRHHRFLNDTGEQYLSKGAGFVLLDMNEFWEGKYLLVCNVHMFSAHKTEDRDERQKQRDEINEEFIKIHKKELFPLGFSWENCGVIVVGTFNTPYFRYDRTGRTTEYLKLTCDFAPRAGATQDFYIQLHPDCQRTQTYDFVNNCYFDHADRDDAGRVDYILGLSSIPRENGARTNTMVLEATECDIIRDVECSDHFAVVASLRPVNSY